MAGGGKRCRGRRPKARDAVGGRYKRRLEDPGAPVDFQFLRSQLGRNSRVKQDELREYTLPDELDRGSEEVRAKNKGLTTMFNKMGHLRRRYVRFMLDGKEASKEGQYILNKLEVFKAEVLITQKQIEAKCAHFYSTPRILLQDILLK